MEAMMLMALLLCRFGGFCSNVHHFDSSLFRLAGAEAAALDPQQRILLEETFSAMHDAESNMLAAIESSAGETLQYTCIVCHIDGAGKQWRS